MVLIVEDLPAERMGTGADQPMANFFFTSTNHL